MRVVVMQKTVSRFVLPALLVLVPAPIKGQTEVTGKAIEQGTQRQPVLRLGLKQAVDIALAPEGNVRIQLTEELIRQAQTRSAQSRAALLPNVDASVGQQNLTRNLEAFGIRIEAPIPGFRVPELVGPFNTFDARATVSQSFFDISSIRRFQASQRAVSAAQAEHESTQDQVTTQVAGAYLTAV